MKLLISVSLVYMFLATFIQGHPINWRTLLSDEEKAEYKTVFHSLTTDLLPFKLFQAAAAGIKFSESPELKQFLDTIDIHDPADIKKAERFFLGKLQELSSTANNQIFNAPNEGTLNDVELIEEEAFEKLRIFILIRALYQNEGFRNEYFSRIGAIIDYINNEEVQTAEKEIVDFLAWNAQLTENMEYDIQATDEQAQTIKQLFHDTVEQLFGDNERIFDVVEKFELDQEFGQDVKHFIDAFLEGTLPREEEATFLIERMSSFLNVLLAIN